MNQKRKTLDMGRSKILFPSKKIRNRMLYIALSLSLFSFGSCIDDEPQPPSTENSYTLKFKSQENLGLIVCQSNQTIEVPTEESEKYFGQRLSLSCPIELQFKNDSLSFIKKNGITEKYKIKWQNNKLFLHNKLLEEWEYCGERRGENYFVLNTAFYIKKERDSQRTLYVTGQKYSLQSFNELIDYIGKDESSSIVWLKQENIFE